MPFRLSEPVTVLIEFQERGDSNRQQSPTLSVYLKLHYRINRNNSNVIFNQRCLIFF